VAVPHRKQVGKIVGGPQVRWTMIPENTIKYADFMAEVGTLKTRPASWKDYFFPEIYDEEGS
jgi:sulfonate transport system substrate-binding protein